LICICICIIYSTCFDYSEKSVEVRFWRFFIWMQRENAVSSARDQFQFTRNGCHT
jgi:hypothetical protein